jgi:hypothetical protein
MQAFCVGISANRERCRCIYLNEPILHAAALALLHQNTSEILQSVRDHFACADLGWSGEFAAQIICLLAAKTPAISSGQSASQFDQNLVDFLSNLLPAARVIHSFNKPVSFAAMPDDFAQSNADDADYERVQWTKDQITKLFNESAIKMLKPQVRILRFTRLQRPPLLADLAMYFLFGLVFVCQRNNKATDLGIVVRYKKAGDSKYYYTVLLIQVKNEVCSYSLQACRELLQSMKLHDTFKVPTPKPTMPFGPTARTFAVNETYSVNTREDCNSRPLLCLLMKTRLSAEESFNHTGVYYSFVSNVDGNFFGTVRGFPQTGLLTEAVISALEGIVADNEVFFQHELPNNISFTNFRASYDLLDAQSIAAHDAGRTLSTSAASATAAATFSVPHSDSKWRSKLTATVYELNTNFTANRKSSRKKPQVGTSLLKAFQYFRSRQVLSIYCQVVMCSIIIFFFFF